MKQFIAGVVVGFLLALLFGQWRPNPYLMPDPLVPRTSLLPCPDGAACTDGTTCSVGRTVWPARADGACFMEDIGR